MSAMTCIPQAEVNLIVLVLLIMWVVSLWLAFTMGAENEAGKWEEVSSDDRGSQRR